MRTAALPDGDRRAAHLADAEVVQGRADADHVGQRVERADLVEVHLVRVDAVRGTLGPGQPGEHVQRAVPHRRGRGRLPSTSARTSAQVRRTSLGGASTSTLVAASPARVTCRAVEPHRLGAQRVDGRLQHGQVGPGPDQRAEQHVAARAGGRVDPEQASRGDRPAARRATRAAKTPAPKPLSMLHTTTPGAHELSIASRAASPPYDVP